MNANKILGGVLLISSTSIGGGVLALPTSTAAAGIIPSVTAFLICWFFMTCGGFYLLEITLWAKTETNLISMAKNTLGLPGQIVAWAAYMLLLYALICAYLLSSTAWLETSVAKYFHYQLNHHYSLLLLTVLTGIIIFFGTKITDYTNRLLSIGLVISYLTLIIVISPHVNLSSFATYKFAAIPATSPLLVTTFGYAIVIPSIVHYLNRDTTELKLAVIIGSTIPLIVYLIWEFVTLGTLSAPGPYSLEALAIQKADGTQVAMALEHTLHSHCITSSARFFSIFAITTSLLGVALSLFHFLADGLKIAQHGKNGMLLFLLTFAPPVAIIYIFPAGFDRILSFGGIFVAILLGILPALMVWFGRYKHKHQGPFQLFGGKPLIIFNILFFSYVISQELWSYR